VRVGVPFGVALTAQPLDGLGELSTTYWDREGRPQRDQVNPGALRV